MAHKFKEEGFEWGVISSFAGEEKKDSQEKQNERFETTGRPDREERYLKGLSGGPWKAEQI